MWTKNQRIKTLAHLKHELTRSILVGYIVCLTVGCGSSYEKDVSTNHSPVSGKNDAYTLQNSEESESGSTSIANTIKSIPKKAGWIRIDVRNSKVKFPRKALEGEEGKFSSTVIPKGSIVLSLRCELDDARPEIVKRCEEYPLGSDYVIHEVTIQDIRGRPFCYIVAAARKMVNNVGGGLHLFSFADEDGDDIFETFLLTDRPGCKYPKWATKGD